MSAPATGVPVSRPPLQAGMWNSPHPYPLPAITAPTPDEAFTHSVQESEARNAQNQMQHDKAKVKAVAEGGAVGMLKGAFHTVAGSVEKTANQLQHTSEAAVRKQLAERNQKAFSYNFPEIATEVVVCCYSCNAFSSGTRTAGNVYVTSRHITFEGPTARHVIPLNTVSSLQPCVTLETSNSKQPYLLPLPAPHVIPNSLRVFTNDNKVYEFMDFDCVSDKAVTTLSAVSSGPAMYRFHNWLDHSWRAAVTVPLPGVNYGPKTW